MDTAMLLGSRMRGAMPLGERVAGSLARAFGHYPLGIRCDIRCTAPVSFVYIRAGCTAGAFKNTDKST